MRFIYWFQKSSFRIAVRPKFIFAWDKQESPPGPTPLLTPRNTQEEPSKRTPPFVSDCIASPESCCREIPTEADGADQGKKAV